MGVFMLLVNTHTLATIINGHIITFPTTFSITQKTLSKVETPTHARLTDKFHIRRTRICVLHRLTEVVGRLLRRKIPDENNNY